MQGASKEHREGKRDGSTALVAMHIVIVFVGTRAILKGLEIKYRPFETSGQCLYCLFIFTEIFVRQDTERGGVVDLRGR